ncbi:MAG: alanine:cation symporter family protein [Oscillospiraceae bacterium]|nr:alanine:cation symporter family protein [Oscillospiraceae bacterium]
MERLLYLLERAVWSWPLLCLILGTGLYLTVRLRFLPLRRLKKAMVLLFRPGEGTGVTPFGALCTTLSATIGTGNLVGVASALVLGGPGALLWMEISAVTGMAVKYAEGFLAVRFRDRDPSGRPFGGPATYIVRGLGPRWRPLAVCFAALGAAAGLCGVGTFVQVGSITACLSGYLTRCFPGASHVLLAGRSVPAAVVVTGLGLTLASALLIFRDIRVISRVSALLVPLMGGLYLVCCLWILMGRLQVLPTVLIRVIRGAVRPEATFGGFFGAVSAGVSRGVFSNEAGLGTGPIAAASAEGVTPAEQGLVSMTASVFDTLLVCTMTGLVILSVEGSLAQGGSWAVMEAFSAALPLPTVCARGLVVVCLTLFAFTTVVGWSFYGLRCLGFLTGNNAVAALVYRIVYVVTVFFAPYFPVQSLWMAANICNGLMAVPNLIGILLLSPVVIRESLGTRRDFRRLISCKRLIFRRKTDIIKYTQ